MSSGDDMPAGIKPYATLLAEPPWDVQQRGAHGRGAARHYDLLPVSQIARLPIGRLAASDAHFWLWVTNASLWAGQQVMGAWGFSCRSILTWIKPRFGLGMYLRNQTEHLLLGVRGKAPIRFGGQGSWRYAPLQDQAISRKSSTPSSSAAARGPTWSCSPAAGSPAGTSGATRWTAMLSSDLTADTWRGTLAEPRPRLTV
jgi:hypothetical protein